jgi:hypothetical protein
MINMDLPAVEVSRGKIGGRLEIKKKWGSLT